MTFSSYAQADFFKDLESQPLEKQLNVLKLRIAFEGQIKEPHDSSQYIERYLSLHPNLPEAIGFLFDQIDRFVNAEARQATLHLVLKKASLKDLMVHQGWVEKQKEEILKTQLDSFLISHINDENIDLILLNKKFFSNFLVQQTKKYDANLDQLLAFMLDYGFLEDAEGVMKSHSLEMIKNSWLQFRNCELNGYQNKYGQAVECFAKLSLPWAGIYGTYYSFLDKKDVKPLLEKFNQSKSNFIYEKKNYAFALSIVYEIVIFKRVSEADQKLLAELIPENEIYPNFLLYALSKNQNILNEKLRQQLLANMQKHHAARYLFRVASGAEKPTLILNNLPKENLTRLAASRL